MANQVYDLVMDFEDHLKGDTWDGYDFQILDEITLVPISLVGASIRAMFRLQGKSTKMYEMSTSLGTITITNAANGEFGLDEQIINFDAGIYLYDIEVTLASGQVKTRIGGKWVIKQDVTY